MTERIARKTRNHQTLRERIGNSSADETQISRENALAMVVTHIESPESSVYTELILEQAGILDELERISVIPKLLNPNPVDLDIDELAHERWWEEHPVEAEQFETTYHLREKVLIALHAGAVLGTFIRSFDADNPHKFRDEK